MSVSGVSFIVCSFNGAQRVPSVLEHLAQQRMVDGAPFEVVLVDNASTDHTALVAEQCWRSSACPAPIKIVHEPQAGLSFARAAGIKAAAYEVLCFIDDDNLVSSDWCCRVLEKMRADPGLGAIGARGVPEFAGGVAPPSWFPRHQAAYAVGPQHYRNLPLRRFYGAGLTIRKAALDGLDARGFSPILSGRAGTAMGAGDDTELCYALGMAGWRLDYDPDLLFKHVIPAKRLEKRYLLALYRGFGRSSATLDMYLLIAASRSAANPGRLALRHRLTGLCSTTYKVFYWTGRRAAFLLEDEDARLHTRAQNIYFINRLYEFLRSWNACRSHAMTLAAVFSDYGRPLSRQ